MFVKRFADQMKGAAGRGAARWRQLLWVRMHTQPSSLRPTRRSQPRAHIWAGRWAGLPVGLQSCPKRGREAPAAGRLVVGREQDVGAPSPWSSRVGRPNPPSSQTAAGGGHTLCPDLWRECPVFWKHD